MAKPNALVASGLSVTLAAAGLGAALAACAPAASNLPTAAPATAGASTSARPTAAPSPPASPTGRATLEPAPSGHLAVPGEFALELKPGRYWSTPPFDLGFSFVVDQPGWVAGHLNAEFFDIQWYDGPVLEGLPERMIAFALPTTIQGATDVPVTGLTPAEAVAELVARRNLATTNVVELQMFGRSSVRADIHVPDAFTPIFDGADGTFTMSTARDGRFVVAPIDDGLFLAIVMARPAELERAWQEALPLLESIRLSIP